MPWSILRDSNGLVDDPDFRGLVLGDVGALTLADMAPAGQVVGAYSNSFDGTMHVRIMFLDVSGDRVGQPGSVEVQLVTLDDLGSERVFSVGAFQTNTGYRPLQYSISETGFVSVRFAGFVGPAAVASIRAWVFRR